MTLDEAEQLTIAMLDAKMKEELDDLVERGATPDEVYRFCEALDEVRAKHIAQVRKMLIGTLN